MGSMQVRTGIPERVCVLLSLLQEVQLPGSPRPLCISQFSCGRKHARVRWLQCSSLPGCFWLHSDQQERPCVNSVVPFCSSEPNFQDLIQCSSSMKPSLITLVLTIVSLDEALHSLSHSLAFQWAEALEYWRALFP